MKNKKSFIYMLTVLASVACMGFASCKDESPKPKAIVDIRQESETLNVLQETELNVSTENATEAVVWSSSNETVATVKNGVVTALNVGTVTITAKANGSSDTCVVEVLRSNEAPILNVSRDRVSIDKNDEYTLTASVKWLGEDVTDKVALDWMLGSGAQEGVATVASTENGVAVIKGIAVGETEFYVCATVGDAYVNQKISVVVCDSSVWFESTELEIGPNGNFSFSMLSLDENENPASTDFPEIQAYNADGKIENATYIWSSKDESIIKIENGKFVAGRAGEVELHGNYQGHEVIITAVVERTTFRLDDTVDFELADLKPVEFEVQNGDKGEVYLDDILIGVFDDGKITLDASKYPTASRELGAREIVLQTSNASYVLTANLYSMLIETSEELDAWHAHAFENGDDGYYALANDIEYSGVYTGSRNWDTTGYKWASPDDVGFRGIFDGKGHIIDGLRIEEGFRGFVTLLRSEGIIRNIAFMNVSYSAIGAFVCLWGCGTIENVYLQYAMNARMGYWDKTATFGGAFLATDNTRDMQGKMTIKNCFVDASQTTLERDNQSYIGGFMKYDKTEQKWHYEGAYAKLDGVYVLGPDTTKTGGEAKLVYNDLVTGSANYALYHSASEMAEDKDAQTVISKWDSEFWAVKNGLPTPLSVIALGDLLTINKPDTSIYYTFDGAKATYPGKAYSFTVTPIKTGFDTFIVYVNGTELQPKNGVYTVENVQSALNIKVAHPYIESGNATTTIEYTEATGAWKINNSVLASYEGVREHGNAYISKEYIAYMMSQGYTKLQFTIKPDKVVALQALYRYNGKDYVAYGNADRESNVEAKTVTIDLTVASELEIYGTNERGSGSAIREKGSYLIVTELKFSK